MGTWGTSAFDNDEAADWLRDFASDRRMKRLVDLLRNYPAADGSDAEAVTACEVVSALHGHASEGLDPDVELWAEKQRAKPIARDLIQRALKVAGQVRDASQLASLWKESDQHDSWRERMDGLIERLSRPARAGPPPRRTPVLSVQVGEEPVRLRMDASLETKLSRRPGALSFDITQELTEGEWELLLATLSRFPELALGLTAGAIRKVTAARLEETLARFSKRRQLSLRFDLKNSFSALQKLSSVQELSITYLGKEGGGAELAQLPELKRLKLLSMKPFPKVMAALAETRLEALDATQVSITRVTPEGSATDSEGTTAPAKLPTSLRYLGLSGIAIQSETLSLLPRLEVLQLHNVRCDPSSLSLESPLRVLFIASVSGVTSAHVGPTLRALRIESIREGAPALKVMGLAKLLSLNAQAATLASWEALSVACPILRQLTIKRTQNDDLSFLRGPPMRSVERVHLEVRDWSDLQALEAFSSVKYLQLRFGADLWLSCTAAAFEPLRALDSLSIVELPKGSSHEEGRGESVPVPADPLREYLRQELKLASGGQELDAWRASLRQDIYGSDDLRWMDGNRPFAGAAIE